MPERLENPVLQVKRILQRVREGWPGAAVQASTFDAFTHKLLKQADKGRIMLPEVSAPVFVQGQGAGKGGRTPGLPLSALFPKTRLPAGPGQGARWPGVLLGGAAGRLPGLRRDLWWHSLGECRGAGDTGDWRHLDPRWVCVRSRSFGFGE